ncbi:c-type cytochrome [Burkholderia multivorans]|uniref:c-type cytochrome n=1 Tax=Burkholderia multivorans TaxID=87883 RepID=UPI000D0150B3|nr:c-type cytochrome [Burkholderia multivorans]MBU9456796.1 c-type cytochrome [Burkholderia multivorans]PRH46299.1 cytochrome C [Burkholderia multivorans]
MKKYVALGIAAMLGLVFVLCGPELLNLYRLQRYVTVSSQQYETDGGAWPHLTDECFICHGVRGNAANQDYPSLAGQPARYLETQLRNFAGEQRRNPNMGPLAIAMSNDQIKYFADYFSREAPVANRYFVASPALREKGERLAAASHCTACHGAELMGHDQFPRLAGQGYDYLVTQLDAFASGLRSEPTGVMKSISSDLSSDDRRAVATYLASLPPSGH